MKLTWITKVVIILSLVSLFTDAASEMLYPIMPLYLKSIGFSIVFIGLLEWVAEAIAGLSKGYFGKLSDATWKRVPFVQLWYSLSALSKPLIGVFNFPLWIFFMRSMDRIGKWIRTGARDAILSDEATKETKGTVFWFHRSFDTLWAVIGPSIALVYLTMYPWQYKTLFFIAFIPWFLAIISSLYLQGKNAQPKDIHVPVPFFSFLYYWKESSPEYKKLVIGLLAFTLFNSSDVFLLLKIKESGVTDTWVILLYIFYNLVYASLALPIGILGDSIGLKKMFLIWLSFFAIVYVWMAFTNNILIFFFLFFLYGIYAAATEGISKAWMSNIVEKKDTATAIGMYTGFQSICALWASTFAGFLWYSFGSAMTFLVTGIVTVGVIVYMQFFANTIKKI